MTGSNPPPEPGAGSKESATVNNEATFEIPTALGEIGAKIPRRGNLLTRLLGRFVLWLFRMKPAGQPPNNSHFLIAAAPHTSNWDGFHFLCCAMALGVDTRWVAKHSLFDGFWGPVLKFMGGVAIDRDRSKGFVDKVADKFAEQESLVVVIAPEGTRATTGGEWKSGFYRMAELAGVPISCGFIDYEKRLVGFGPTIQPSGDYAADLEKMRAFYRHVVPARPERYQI